MTNNPPEPLTPSELAYHALHPKMSLAQVYYVYTHNSIDGRVMYVGKGKGRRAWEFTRRDKSHKAWMESVRHNYIEIIEEGLTELQAFSLENRTLRDEEPRYNLIRNNT